MCFIHHSSQLPFHVLPRSHCPLLPHPSYLSLSSLVPSEILEVNLCLFLCVCVRVMYVHGGFNSLMLSDVLRFTPASCAAFSEHLECVTAVPGMKCLWNSTTSTCMSWDAAAPHDSEGLRNTCSPRGCK